MKLFDTLKNKFNEMFPDDSDPKETPPPVTVSIIMPDGSVEEYNEHFMITDGINCVICQGKFYHTSLDCESLKWEHMNCDAPFKGMTVKDAKSAKMTYCQTCSRENYLHRHGRDES